MHMVSTEASPAPTLSFAYLLCGTLGMLAASGLLAWQPEAMLTRWHPAALAAVHLFALGGLMPVMLGALLQFMPVACGLVLPTRRWLESLILGGLMAGAGLLAAGFLSGRAGAMAAAGALLLTSLSVAGLRLAHALWRQPRANALQAALRRSTLALGMTMGFGAVLLGILILGWNLPLVVLVDWHALWGIAGWVGGLIGSVATVVVPMFHVSQPYPGHWNLALRTLPWLLLTGSAAALTGLGSAATVTSLLLAALIALFGGLTAQRVWASQRGERDAFFWGWLGVALLSVALGALGATAALASDPRWGTAFGLLALAGLGGGTLNVMLYRIVPFLIWLHWQRANKARARLPLLHQIVPERGQRIQLAVDLLAILLLLGACFAPALTRPAALLFAASKLMLLVLLARAMHAYREKLILLRTLPARARNKHA